MPQPAAPWQIAWPLAGGGKQIIPQVVRWSPWAPGLLHALGPAVWGGEQGRAPPPQPPLPPPPPFPPVPLVPPVPPVPAAPPPVPPPAPEAPPLPAAPP